MSLKKQKPSKRKSKAACSQVNLALRKPKERIFSMSWEVLEANRLIDLYHLITGTYFDEDGKQALLNTPAHVYCNAYVGDLAIAIKTATIPTVHCFHMKSRVHAVNDKTGQVAVCEMQVLCNTPLSITEFMFGESEDTLLFEECGIKTKWKGFYPMFQDFMDSFSDDFEITTNYCTLSCKTAFHSKMHEQQFQAFSLIHKTPNSMRNGQRIA